MTTIHPHIFSMLSASQTKYQSKKRTAGSKKSNKASSRKLGKTGSSKANSSRKRGAKRTYDDLVDCKTRLAKVQDEFNTISREVYSSVECGDISERKFKGGGWNVAFTEPSEQAEGLSYKMMEPLIAQWFVDHGERTSRASENATDMVEFIKLKRRRVPKKGGFRITKAKA